MNYSMKMREVILEFAGVLYLISMMMVLYATGAVTMYNTPIPSWYYATAAIVLLVPVLIGIRFAAIAIIKMIIRARKPVAYGVIPSRVIVRVMRDKRKER